ncbi:hypothetical protein LCGC14_1616430 [marine sediment metagenome]|uniref:Uncharacterized protein n=1 Tax=marine sediment metagenome TaxID=412755 RepID=A0A0F9KMA1_9ZZZZ
MNDPNLIQAVEQVSAQIFVLYVLLCIFSGIIIVLLFIKR